METHASFAEAKQKYLKTLKQYVPVVARVHGGNHPEFYDVRATFDEIAAKIGRTRTGKIALDAEFGKLRSITGNYNVPGDVCETYEAVYKMLSELDQAYFAD